MRLSDKDRVFLQSLPMPIAHVRGRTAEKNERERLRRLQLAGLVRVTVRDGGAALPGGQVADLSRTELCDKLLACTVREAEMVRSGAQRPGCASCAAPWGKRWLAAGLALCPVCRAELEAVA